MTRRPIMYERVGHEGRRPSPFSWRIRYAIAHKGADFDYRPTRFADVEQVRALSGQHYVPIVVNGREVVHDSWSIACWLEERYPEGPSLFGGDAGQGLARTMNFWANLSLAPAIRRLISADFPAVLAEEDRAYFRSSREAMFGCTLEEYCADRPAALAELAKVTAPLEATLAEQRFLAGAAPNQADYIVFSLFQYARLGSPQELLPTGSALRDWRNRMIGLFDGLGDMFPGYPQG